MKTLLEEINTTLKPIRRKLYHFFSDNNLDIEIFEIYLKLSRDDAYVNILDLEEELHDANIDFDRYTFDWTGVGLHYDAKSETIIKIKK